MILDHVPHAANHLPCHIDAGIACPPRHDAAVVEQHFVAADLYEKRRQTGRIVRDKFDIDLKAAKFEAAVFA